MQADQATTPASNQPASQSRGRWPLILVIALCAAPMIFSYLSYYVIKPEGRTNYGALIDPLAYPIPELGLTTLEGSSAALEQFKGKWILLQVKKDLCKSNMVIVKRPMLLKIQ